MKHKLDIIATYVSDKALVSIMYKIPKLVRKRHFIQIHEKNIRLNRHLTVEELQIYSEFKICLILSFIWKGKLIPERYHFYPTGQIKESFLSVFRDVTKIWRSCENIG